MNAVVGRNIAGCVEVYLSSVLLVLFLLLELQNADLSGDSIDCMIAWGSLVIATGHRYAQLIGQLLWCQKFTLNKSVLAVLKAVLLWRIYKNVLFLTWSWPLRLLGLLGGPALWSGKRFGSARDDLGSFEVFDIFVVISGGLRPLDVGGLITR